MSKQSAVEWLKKEVQMNRFYTLKGRREAFEKAIQMEKEQIINAWRNGDNDSMYPPQELDRQAEEYYNETYGKE